MSEASGTTYVDALSDADPGVDAGWIRVYRCLVPGLIWHFPFVQFAFFSKAVPPAR